MKNLFLTLACAGLAACSQPKGSGDSTSPGSSPSITESDVRSTWVELTRQDGRWVIFEPCEASNLKLYWKVDTLVIEWGQMATMDLIRNIKSAKGQFLLEGIDSTSNPPNHSFRIEAVDSVPGLARWWLPTDQEPRLLVKEKEKDKYPTIKESCEGFFDVPKK